MFYHIKIRLSGKNKKFITDKILYDNRIVYSILKPMPLEIINIDDTLCQLAIMAHITNNGEKEYDSKIDVLCRFAGMPTSDVSNEMVYSDMKRLLNKYGKDKLYDFSPTENSSAVILLTLYEAGKIFIKNQMKFGAISPNVWMYKHWKAGENPFMTQINGNCIYFSDISIPYWLLDEIERLAIRHNVNYSFIICNVERTRIVDTYQMAFDISNPIETIKKEFSEYNTKAFDEVVSKILRGEKK